MGISGAQTAAFLDEAATIMRRHKRLTDAGYPLPPLPTEFESFEQMKQILRDAHAQVGDVYSNQNR